MSQSTNGRSRRPSRRCTRIRESIQSHADRVPPKRHIQESQSREEANRSGYQSSAHPPDRSPYNSPRSRQALRVPGAGQTSACPIAQPSRKKPASQSNPNSQSGGILCQGRSICKRGRGLPARRRTSSAATNTSPPQIHAAGLSRRPRSMPTLFLLISPPPDDPSSILLFCPSICDIGG